MTKAVSPETGARRWREGPEPRPGRARSLRSLRSGGEGEGGPTASDQARDGVRTGEAGALQPHGRGAPEPTARPATPTALATCKVAAAGSQPHTPGASRPQKQGADRISRVSPRTRGPCPERLQVTAYRPRASFPKPAWRAHSPHRGRFSTGPLLRLRELIV